jgi:hypothetical protein
VVAPAEQHAEWFFRRLAGELAALLGQQEIFIHCTPVAVVEALELAALELTQFPRPHALTAPGHTV